jgi:sugar transferase (PEP-CTERM/EpsH1 system associated)
MNVLFLAHRLPFPPNKGDKIRSYHMLRHLAARHDVWVASLVDDPRDVPHVDGLREFVREVYVDRLDERSKGIAAARALLACRPVSLQWFHTAALQSAVDAMIDRVDFDAVVGFSSPMAEYVFRSRHASGRLAPVAKAMDLIDVDSYKWRQYAERTRSPARFVYAREGRLLAEYERLLAREFDALFVTSEQEKAFFPGAPALTNLHAMQNGVDLDGYAPGRRAALDLGPAALVFTGVMDYWPNVEGVQWFADRVWPRVLAAVPEARFYVVGSRPTSEVLRLAERPGITVTGYVDDVRDYLAGAAACVAPLRIARGLQNKVLEAMASARAVVSTAEAFEGIAGEAGRDVLIGADETSFADACVRLLQDRELAARLGANARGCMERGYAWDRNLAVLDEFMDRAAATRRARETER